jgi:DNA-binding transcriptional MocR family regulator
MIDTTVVDFLNEELLYRRGVNADVVAALMVSCVLDAEVNRGKELPTQEEIIIKCSLHARVVQEAWNKLKYSYCVIKTQKGVGTKYIDYIAADHWKEMNQNRLLILANNRLIPFNHLNKSVFAKEQKGFSNSMRAASNVYRQKEFSTLKLQEAPGLRLNLSDHLSASLFYTFAEEQVFYTDDCKVMINNLIEINQNKSQKMLVINPIAIEDNKLVRNKQRWQEFNNKATEICVADLEEHCLLSRVNLVYLSPPTPLPYDLRVFKEIWQMVLFLSNKYQFKIIVNDTYQEFFEDPFIFKEARHTGELSFYYITTMSQLDHKLEEVAVIAGPAPGIANLKAKYKNISSFIPMTTAYAIQYLILNKKLQEYEEVSLTEIAQRRPLATEKIMSYALFKEQHLNDQRQWFYHLQPAEGRFERGIQKKLYAMKIAVILEESLQFGHHFKGGITISISSFSDINAQAKELGVLINYLKPKIKKNLT